MFVVSKWKGEALTGKRLTIVEAMHSESLLIFESFFSSFFIVCFFLFFFIFFMRRNYHVTTIRTWTETVIVNIYYNDRLVLFGPSPLQGRTS